MVPCEFANHQQSFEEASARCVLPVIFIKQSKKTACIQQNSR